MSFRAPFSCPEMLGGLRWRASFFMATTASLQRSTSATTTLRSWSVATALAPSERRARACRAATRGSISAPARSWSRTSAAATARTTSGDGLRRARPPRSMTVRFFCAAVSSCGSTSMPKICSRAPQRMRRRRRPRPSRRRRFRRHPRLSRRRRVSLSSPRRTRILRTHFCRSTAALATGSTTSYRPTRRASWTSKQPSRSKTCTWPTKS